MTHSAQKSVLISGGGVAGCALAYFLRRRGFRPVVVESAPAFGRVGYLLAINEQIGQQVAGKMGLLATLKNFEVPLTKNSLYDVHGRLITSFELDRETHNKRVGLMLNRADLHMTLYDAVREDTEFRFGEEIASLEQRDEDVSVSFSSGKKEAFDLVVGADGVHSNTRRLVFGTGFEVPLGQAYFAFTAPNRAKMKIAGENETVVVRGDGFSIAYHMLRDGDVGGYVFHREDTHEELQPRERRGYLLRRYGPCSTAFTAILESMTDEDVIFHDGFIRIDMPSWHRGMVCLLGDAAYCPTPASGVGASMAMAGAYVLANNLSRTDDHAEAFERYESYLRPTIKKAQTSAIRMARLAGGGNFISYEFTNALLRLLPMSLISRLHSHAIEMALD